MGGVEEAGFEGQGGAEGGGRIPMMDPLTKRALFLEQLEPEGWDAAWQLFVVLVPFYQSQRRRGSYLRLRGIPERHMMALTARERKKGGLGEKHVA